MGASSRGTRQVATVACDDGRICLVTSRRSKRWIIPKGSIPHGMTDQEVALQEVWEEAGLVGTLRPVAPMTYSFERAGKLSHVAVYAMDVTQVADSWPEKSMRRRRWVAPRQAVSIVRCKQTRQAITALTAEEQEAREQPSEVHDLLANLLRHAGGPPPQEWHLHWHQSKTGAELTLVLGEGRTHLVDNSPANGLQRNRSDAA